MDPAKILFTAIGTMTNGLISDATTLLLGLLVLAFLAMGADLMIDTVTNGLESRKRDKYFKAAETMRMERDQYRKGTHEYDESNLMYWEFIKKSARSRTRGFKL